MPDSRRRDGAEPTDPRTTPRTVPDACPGAWRRHDAADGALARFRPVGGAVTGAELRVLADAAATGGSPLELTSRGSLQVRGLTAEGADRLAATLSALGGDGALLDAQGRDVPCSVVASPLGTARRRGPRRRRRPARAHRRARPAARRPRRRHRRRGRPRRRTSRWSTERSRSPAPRPDLTGDPAALALAAVEAFLEVRGSAWRVAEVGPERVAGALRAREHFGVPEHAEVLTWPEATRARSSRASGRSTHRPRECSPTSPTPGATLRVTPWRTVVLRDLADPDDALRRLAGLVETGPSPWSHLSACVGAPRCARSHTDVRGDLARAVATGRAGGLLHAHWVGCSRACGTPAGPVAVVEGTPDGTYRTIVRAGRVSP